MSGNLRTDFRYALRLYARSPGFAAIVVATLALGIGSCVAVFSILDAVLIRPLPYPSPQQLVMMWETNPKRALLKAPVMDGAFPIFELENRGFEALAAFTPPERSDPPETIWPTSEPVITSACSSSLFNVLRVRPILGRTILPDDEESRDSRVAVLSYRFWQAHYHGDRNLIGKTLTLNNSGVKFTYTIVGVLPDSFVFPYPLSPDSPDVWEALLNPVGLTGVNSLLVLGRLKPRTTLDQARLDLQTVANRIAAEYPRYQGEQIILTPLAQEVISGQSTALLVLSVAVGFLLLIACANVGNMFLARSMRREKEIAIRKAFGASRTVLIWQMLTESAILGLLGGAMGVLLAFWFLRSLVALIPSTYYVPRLNEVGVNGTVLGFALAASIASAVMFGLLPALRLSGSELGATLRSGTEKARRNRFVFGRPGSLLLVSQLAMAVVLLIGSFLMIRSLRQLLAVNRHFQPDHLLTMDFGFSNSVDVEPQRETILYQEFLKRARALAGVQDVALDIGFLDAHPRIIQVKAEGGGSAITESFHPVEEDSVTPELFGILRMTLVEGRLFNSTDTMNSPPVVIVNDEFLRRYWPDANPLGVRLQLGPPGPGKPYYVKIVGVVRESRRFGTGERASPAVYFAAMQNPSRGYAIVARTARNPQSLAAALRKEAEEILPGEILVSDVQTGEQIVAHSTTRLRVIALQLGILAGFALVLAALGVYGLIAYFTSQRTREIGVRIALGAYPDSVFWLVVGQGMKLALTGISIGIILALGLTRVMHSLLFGVSDTDPVTFLGVIISLTFTTLAACYFPARRAMRVDPMVALRYE